MFQSSVAQLQVELICATLNPPLRMQGTIRDVEGRSCWVDLEEAPPSSLTPDLGVVLDVQDHSSLHIVGIVRARTERAIKLEISRIAHHEKRYFPREDGGLEVQYKPVESLERAAKGWLHGLHEVDDSDWMHPPPFMNFSGSGLRFEVAAALPEDSGVLLSFKIPGDPNLYRATARVVRCDAIGAHTYAAVEFVEIAPEAVQALADFTMERQLEQLAAASF